VCSVEFNIFAANYTAFSRFFGRFLDDPGRWRFAPAEGISRERARQLFICGDEVAKLGEAAPNLLPRQPRHPSDYPPPCVFPRFV
jgi:hypothetical protein